MVRLYKDEGAVEYAEPNYIAHALMIPNDPYYKYQWHLDDSHTNNPEGNTSNPYGGTNGGGIRMEEAWNISNGSKVVVAVIDTGVAYENYPTFRPKYYLAPDLAKTCFVSGWNFVNNDAHPNDDNSHGTHVTGTIAQSTNNKLGVAGVAFGACIMPVKVLDRSGSGSYYNVAQGIYYAANNNASVISMSLGGSFSSDDLKNALNYSYNKGVTIVAAAGNSGKGGSPSYPAAYNEYVIAVAATRYDETRASYSTTGDYVDIAAPGGDTSVDQNGDGYGDGVLQQTFNPYTQRTNDFGYWFFQGTSMATPHVSGVAALLIARGVTGPANVTRALESTAEDKGSSGWDSKYGWGIVDAYNATVNYPPP
jgi:serine protease